jgi:transposase
MTPIPSLPAPAIFRKGGKDYRRWTEAHKRQIVEESFSPGASVSIVARRHDVNANQVFKWRLLYQRGELGEPVQAIDGFLPVGMIGHDGVLQPVKPAPPKPLPVIPSVPSTSSAPASSGIPPVITLSLRKGAQVRMEGELRLPVLRCVLKTVLGES